MKQRREEDKCLIKRLYYRYEPYISLGSLCALLPILYVAFTFYMQTTDANANIPILKAQVEENTREIATNRAETDKQFALANQKLDLMMEFWQVPGRYNVGKK